MATAETAVITPGRVSKGRFAVSLSFLIAGAFLLLLILFAVVPHLFTSVPPNEQNLKDSLAPPFWNGGGSWSHPLGTDTLGRDIWSRLVYGTRTSLGVGLAATTLAALIGVTFGLLSGYFGGIVERFLMGWTDAQQGMPAIIILLVLILSFGSTPRVLILGLGATFWMVFSRVVRAKVLSLRESSFIDSSRVIGCSHLRIIFRHVVPHLWPTIIPLIALMVARLLLVESGLSFLSIGVQPPAVSWGLVLGDGRDLIGLAYWVASFAGLIISLAVIALTVFARWVVPVLDRGGSGRDAR